jgi:PQQ-dependent dehydrogenase (methanol/ethanol family)
MTPVRLALYAVLTGGLMAYAVPSVGQTSVEIEGAHNAKRTVVGEVPSTSDVNIADNALLNADASPGNWLIHGHDYSNRRYSSLDQIDTGNVARLTPVAIVQTGMTGSSFETTPLVVNGVMYATTPTIDHKLQIMAMNAATGDLFWETTIDIPNFKICCGADNRGVAEANGHLYVATLDNQLISLDARSGKVQWETTVADWRAGYSETMTPQVYDGLVIVGSAGGEWPLRGFVAAYHADTGKQAWRFDTTDPKTYAGESWKTGGGMVWNTPAIDPKLGLVIFAVGNPNTDLYGASREGDNLYSDSIVALHVKTGELAWYYQEVKHDVWDYDATSNVVLFDVKQNGETIPAAGEAGKVGWFFIVDRRNGHLIRKSDPFVTMSKAMFTAPTAAGVKILPGANGGSEWSPPAYSPKTHDVYILGMNQLMSFTTKGEPTTLPGTIRLGSAFANVKQDGIQTGTFTAVDVESGKIDWQYHAPQPMIGGALATAGNLVFTGEGNGFFDAFDATTGKILWRFNLGAGVNAPPITYKVGDTQYVAVAAGGNFQMPFPYGDVIAIFKVAS